MGLKDLSLAGGLCLAHWTSTTMGLKDLPLVGGLCLAQWTSTTKGLKDLPLVGELCLVQQILTIKASNHTNEPQGQMTHPVDNRVRENCNHSQVMNIQSKAERGMDIMLHSIIYL
jgi:hypothetical protein